MFACTFFPKSRLVCTEMVMIGYLGIMEGSYTSFGNETGHSTVTIMDYLRHCRHLVAGFLMKTIVLLADLGL